MCLSVQNDFSVTLYSICYKKKSIEAHMFTQSYGRDEAAEKRQQVENVLEKTIMYFWEYSTEMTHPRMKISTQNTPLQLNTPSMFCQIVLIYI